MRRAQLAMVQPEAVVGEQTFRPLVSAGARRGSTGTLSLGGVFD
jgi:hypothetical protein